MKKLLLLTGLVLLTAVELSVAGPASASFIIGRNPQHPTLKVDATGHALISFSVGGQQQHVLVWGAENALPPTRGRTQTAFKVDFSGGFALHESNYYKTIKNVCKPYTGPPLAWYVPGSGCTAPDGSFWALQVWQRMLPDLGFKPWKPEQAVYEAASRLRGPTAAQPRSKSGGAGAQGRSLFTSCSANSPTAGSRFSVSAPRASGSPPTPGGGTCTWTPSTRPTGRAGAARTRSSASNRTAPSATCVLAPPAASLSGVPGLAAPPRPREQVPDHRARAGRHAGRNVRGPMSGNWDPNDAAGYSRARRRRVASRRSRRSASRRPSVTAKRVVAGPGSLALPRAAERRVCEWKLTESFEQVFRQRLLPTARQLDREGRALVRPRGDGDAAAHLLHETA